MTTRAVFPRWDPTDQTLVASPYRAYADLRAHDGPARGGPGQWVYSRHEDVRELLRHPALGKLLPEAYYRLSVGGDPVLGRFLSQMNLGHRDVELGRATSSVFSAPRMRRLGERMDAWLEETLAPMVGAGPVEMVQWVALPFPLSVVSDLIGIPLADREAVARRATALVRGFSDAAFLDDRGKADASVALSWLREYLSALLGDGLRAAPDGLLASLQRDLAPQVDPARIVDTAIMVLYAGFETSAAMIANAVKTFAEQPRALDQLRAEPWSTASATEEVLRIEAPIQVTMRVAQEQVVHRGHAIRPGRMVLLLLGAANRDPAVFGDPDVCDVARSPNPHVSFGGGPFRCVGAALARAEGRAFLSCFARHVRSVELLAPPVHENRLNFRSLRSLEVALR